MSGLASLITLLAIFTWIPFPAAANLPYPGPSEPVPATALPVATVIPTLPPLPTLEPYPPDVLPSGMTYAQGAIQFVSQRKKVSLEALLIVDEFKLDLPVSGRGIWQGWVVDKEGQVAVEVVINKHDRTILSGSGRDLQQLWQTEEKAFRQKHEKRILKFAAQKMGVTESTLEILHGVFEHFLLTEQTVWRGKVIHQQTGQVEEVVFDATGRPADIETVAVAETKAHANKYGKLDPNLYYRFGRWDKNQRVKVLLWLNGVDANQINNTLAQRYQHLGVEGFLSGQPVNMAGQPMPIEPKIFEKIRAEYQAALAAAHRQSALSVVDYLQRR